MLGLMTNFFSNSKQKCNLVRCGFGSVDPAHVAYFSSDAIFTVLYLNAIDSVLVLSWIAIMLADQMSEVLRKRCSNSCSLCKGIYSLEKGCLFLSGLVLNMLKRFLLLLFLVVLPTVPSGKSKSRGDASPSTPQGHHAYSMVPGPLGASECPFSFIKGYRNKLGGVVALYWISCFLQVPSPPSC
jgi:hypothetical protein